MPDEFKEFDDLGDLLDQLEEDEEIGEEIDEDEQDDSIDSIDNSPEEKPEVFPAKKSKPKPKSKPEPIKSNTEGNIKNNINPSKDDSNKKSDNSTQVSDLHESLMAQAKELSSSIWDKLQEDRKLIDQYIGLFSHRIQDPDTTKTAYIEAITSLLNSKASTSINSSKILDSIAKIMASTKNMKTETTDINLSDLLQDSSDDFDPNEP